MPDKKDINITTLQVLLKSAHGKVVEINKRFREQDLKSYRDLISETCKSIGLDVDIVVLTHNDMPEGVKMVAVEPPVKSVKPQKLVEDNSTENEEIFEPIKPKMK
jgi:hypothetical protein